MEEGVAEGDGITAVAAVEEADTTAATKAGEVEADGEESAAASKHSPQQELYNTGSLSRCFFFFKPVINNCT